MIEACPAELLAVIYTDHSGTVAIAIATSLSSTSLERQNLRLVRASQFIQQFRLKVFHRPGKSNRIADALSRLPSSTQTPPTQLDSLDELQAPYVIEPPQAPTAPEAPTAYQLTVSLLQVSQDTKARILTLPLS